MITHDEFTKMIYVVAEHFHIQPSSILGKDRTQKASIPRHITCYILKSTYDLCFPKIRDLLDRRDHTTILHSYRLVEGDPRYLKTVHTILDKLRAKVWCPNVTVTWNDAIKLAVKIAYQLPKRKYTIVAHPRGGLPVATLLAHLLSVTDVSVSPIGRLESSSTLWVDDIVDSGTTLKNIKHHYPKATTVALFVRSTTPIWPTIYGEIVKDSSFIVFPWEIPAIATTTSSQSPTREETVLTSEMSNVSR